MTSVPFENLMLDSIGNGRKKMTAESVKLPFHCFTIKEEGSTEKGMNLIDTKSSEVYIFKRSKSTFPVKIPFHNLCGGGGGGGHHGVLLRWAVW